MSAEQFSVLGVLGVPLIAAVVAWVLGPKRGPAVRLVSVIASVLTFALALFLAVQFMLLDRTEANTSPTFVPEFVPGSTADNPHTTTWNVLPIGNTNVQFFLGIDGLNIWLVVLTALLMLPCVLVSFNHVQERVNEFYAWLLASLGGVIAVFLSFDVVLFYVFFELTLVPLFFLIGIWGGSDRRYAARKFFVYTLAGSMITLLGVLGVVIAAYSNSHWQPEKRELAFSIPRLVEQVHDQLKGDASVYGPKTDDDKQKAKAWATTVRDSWGPIQFWAFLAMSVGFAVKVPLMPFHTWLPLAHTEAPTAGSVDLAGVLLKLGCYGFLRLCIPLTPDAALSLGLPLILWISVIGIIYGAFCAYAQDDVKKLIAYSSVSHMGLIMLGMFSLNVTGLQGSLIQMINHGLSTPLLFLLIGMIYERYHTRKLAEYSGMATKMPLFGVFLVFACLSSVGLPGLNGFIGEFLCLAGIYEYEGSVLRRMLLTGLAASGMVLGAWYLFTMLRKLLFGPVKEPHHEGHEIKDLNAREVCLLAPLVVLCFVLGVHPDFFLKTSEPDMQKIAAYANDARTRAKVAQAAKQPPARAEAGRE